MFFVLVYVSLKKDLTIFLKFGSLGAICVACLTTLVIYYGSYGLANTKYNLHWKPSNVDKEILDVSNLVLFSPDFSSLAGVLCAGYFLHQQTIPITKNAKEPKKNLRNVFIGYLLGFLTYSILGIFGYIGFSGNFFKADHYDPASASIKIEDSFLNMFEPSDYTAIFGRLLISCQLCCAYPLVNHFQR
jgi:amino acid transporter